MVTILHEDTNCSMKPGADWEFVEGSKGGIATAVKEAGTGGYSRQVSHDFLGRAVSRTRLPKTRGRDLPIRPSMLLAYSGWWIIREGKASPYHLGKA